MPGMPDPTYEIIPKDMGHQIKVSCGNRQELFPLLYHLSIGSRVDILCYYDTSKSLCVPLIHLNGRDYFIFSNSNSNKREKPFRTSTNVIFDIDLIDSNDKDHLILTSTRITSDRLIALAKLGHIIPQQSFLERLHQSTFGGHFWRTVTGIALLASFLLFLFLSPASFPLLPIFTNALGMASAKVLVATLGGLLALTAPKWFGNLCQFVGKRLLGGLVGGIIFFLQALPYYLAHALDVKTKGGDKNLAFSVIEFIFCYPLVIIDIVVSFLGAIINKSGVILSGEHMPCLESSSPTSSEKIISALTDTFSATEKAIHDPALFFPENRALLAEKYDRFFAWLKPFNLRILNLCEKKDMIDGFGRLGIL